MTYIPRSSTHYGGIFADWGKSVLAANFRVFCDVRNYPVYFHCIAGADGGTWQRRIELYLLDCGVTEEEIAAFKSIMLE